MVSPLIFGKSSSLLFIIILQTAIKTIGQKYEFTKKIPYFWQKDNTLLLISGTRMKLEGKFRKSNSL